MHNTVWDMNDRNCVVLGPTAPLEYLVLQRVLVSYTESVSNIILDVHLITEIVLYARAYPPAPRTAASAAFVACKSTRG